jgi:hypothetical protein
VNVWHLVLGVALMAVGLLVLAGMAWQAATARRRRRRDPVDAAYDDARDVLAEDLPGGVWAGLAARAALTPDDPALDQPPSGRRPDGRPYDEDGCDCEDCVSFDEDFAELAERELADVAEPPHVPAWLVEETLRQIREHLNPPAPPRPPVIPGREDQP